MTSSPHSSAPCHSTLIMNYWPATQQPDIILMWTRSLETVALWLTQVQGCTFQAFAHYIITHTTSLADIMQIGKVYSKWSIPVWSLHEVELVGIFSLLYISLCNTLIYRRHETDLCNITNSMLFLNPLRVITRGDFRTSPIRGMIIRKKIQFPSVVYKGHRV